MPYVSSWGSLLYAFCVISHEKSNRFLGILLTMPKRLRIIVSMKRLTTEKRALILRCFTEGLGVNATARMADVSKNTVLKLLADLGPVCRDFQAFTLVNLQSRKIQVDEIWAFTGMKQKNVQPAQAGTWGIGDCWTW